MAESWGSLPLKANPFLVRSSNKMQSSHLTQRHPRHTQEPHKQSHPGSSHMPIPGTGAENPWIWEDRRHRVCTGQMRRRSGLWRQCDPLLGQGPKRQRQFRRPTRSSQNAISRQCALWAGNQWFNNHPSLSRSSPSASSRPCDRRPPSMSSCSSQRRRRHSLGEGWLRCRWRSHSQKRSSRHVCWPLRGPPTSLPPGTMATWDENAPRWKRLGRSSNVPRFTSSRSQTHTLRLGRTNSRTRLYGHHNNLLMPDRHLPPSGRNGDLPVTAVCQSRLAYTA